MLSDKQKQIIRDFALKYGKTALEKQKDTSIQIKGDGVDVVTEMDKYIEKEFYDLITKEFPETGFLGEEFSEFKNEKKYMWTIDPIDGTKYYAKLIPVWTVSIALLKDGKPIYGLIYYPVMDQLFEAEIGKGAYLNGKKLQLTKDTDISKLQLSWDCPSYHNFNDSIREKIMMDLKSYSENYYRVRNIGIATLSICWITTGFFGGYIKYCTTEKEKLDNYAGLIIAEEAGCKIKYTDYGDYLKIEVLI